MISPLNFLLANSALLASLASALPTVVNAHDHHGISNTTEHYGNHVQQFDHISNHTLKARTCSHDGPKVHIMPTGDSLAQGFPGENIADQLWAYRKELIRLMGTGENPISYVGSQHRGSGHNLQTFEAYKASNVTQVREQVMPALPGISPTPDGIILNAGTRDILWEGSTEKTIDTPARMGSFLEALWAFNDNLVIILSALPPLTNNDVVGNNRLWMNQEYKKLVDTYAAQGRKILYADLDTKLTAADMADGQNPSQVGYRKMAAVLQTL